MRCRCPSCQTELSFEGEAPRFCSRCGSSLSTIITAELEATGVYTPEEKTYVPYGSDGKPSATPDQVGGYRLVRKIGSGGMGSVYEAEDLASGQRVALKLVKRGSELSDSGTQRFRQEGRLASSISHPRCVFVIAADEDRGQPYIVMELMPGQTFNDLVRSEGPLPASKAVALICDIIDGLQEAHRMGLVHRDVKPANCFMDERGRAKIGDFGLAKVLDQKNAGDAPTAMELTGTGTFIGTPLYAAPEQIKGQQVDQQVDVYAVGATLYYLLTGKAPFEDQQSVTAVLARIVSEDPDPLSGVRQDLPAGLEAVVSKALERDRSRRYRDLESLRQSLQAYLPGRHRIVRLGLRVAAYLVDLAAATIVLGLFGFLMGFLVTLTSDEAVHEAIDRIFEDNFISSLIFAVLIQTFFFLIPESLWGTTLGKWCFRLRLTDPDKGGKPSARKVLARNGIFFVVTMVLHWILILATNPPKQTITVVKEADEEATTTWHLDAGNTTVSNIVGLLILSMTMRRRNGYRGLHELYSGTATIWLPPLPPRGQLDITRQASAIPAKATKLETPLVIGGFTISHAMWNDGNATVYIGRDERLSRSVWLWLRPAECGKIDAARRSVSRPTRWRWIGGGVHEGRTWDAFLATPGVTLQSLIDQGQTLDWTATYHMLVELTDELSAAQADQSNPMLCSTQQLWIQQRGNVQWLDVPISPGSPPVASPSPAEQLSFLGQASRVALEGSMMLSGESLKRAIPVSGYSLINRLLAEPVQIASVQELQQELTPLAERPFIVKRWARIRSMIVQAIWFIVLMIVSTFIVVGIGFVVEYSKRTDPGRTVHPAGQEMDALGKLEYFKLFAPRVVPMLIIVFAVCWSAWWRGRWSFGLTGLEIRRHDGARVERWRMAWRTFLLVGLLVLLQWLSSYYVWTSRWMGLSVHWNQLLGVVVGLILFGWIMVSPHRALQDQLAGTVVVPQ